VSIPEGVHMSGTCMNGQTISSSSSDASFIKIAGKTSKLLDGEIILTYPSFLKNTKAFKG